MPSDQERQILKESLPTGLVESSQEARIDGSLDVLVAMRERQAGRGGEMPPSRRTPCLCVCAGGSQAGAGCGRIRLALVENKR